MSLGWILQVLLQGSVKDQEWHRDVLAVRIAEWVQRAHEAEYWLELSSRDLPVLLEQIEG